MKPRVAFYVFSSFLSKVALLPRFFDRGDIMALDLFTPEVFFNTSMTSFSIINSYSTKGRSNNSRLVPSDLIFPCQPCPSLTLGDLNIDHPTADPLRRFKEDKISTSVPYFDTATERGFFLLNIPEVYTSFSMSQIGRPGVIDLAFACPLLISPILRNGPTHCPPLAQILSPFS